MKNMITLFRTPLTLFVSFVLWTVAVCRIDVQAIGPQESSVGFATLNRFVHQLTGVHFDLYILTDWLSLLPVAVCLGFATLGVVQWISRKHITKVDGDLFALGGFYLITMAMYLMFEYVVINYRPVLIEGYLEASYPSSTTMLVLCVMPTAMMQLHRRIRRRPLRIAVLLTMTVFTVFMVTGRLLSGVHWFSDIVGGVLLSAALVTLYDAVCRLIENE